MFLKINILKILLMLFYILIIIAKVLHNIKFQFLDFLNLRNIFKWHLFALITLSQYVIL